jgi:hypothetical protein
MLRNFTLVIKIIRIGIITVPFLLTLLPASVERLTLSQVRVTVITEAMRELHP